MAEAADKNNGFVAAERAGLTFSKDKLYCFSPKAVTVIRGGEDPATWSKTEDRPCWHSSRRYADSYLSFHLTCRINETDPVAARLVTPRGAFYVLSSNQLLLPLPKLIRRHDLERMYLRQFAATIPPPILERLNRLGVRLWHMYQLLARCPSAMELFDSNPGLCYALASSWVFNPRFPKSFMRAARSLSTKRRIVVLEKLGFPPTKSMEHILRKIPPADLSIRQLFYLRNAMASPSAVKKITHAPLLPGPLLRILCDPAVEPLVTPCFINEMLAPPEEPEGSAYGAASDFLDYVRMYRELHQTNPTVEKNAIHSIAGLKRNHDALARQIRRIRSEYYCQQIPKPFPRPPLAGTENILPINTVEDLLMESEEMNNCATFYANEIRRGKYYIYRVLQPVRATLGVVLGQINWRIDQVRGRDNTKLKAADFKRIVSEFGF